jgi:hypothetical protein
LGTLVVLGRSASRCFVIKRDSPSAARGPAAQGRDFLGPFTADLKGLLHPVCGRFFLPADNFFAAVRGHFFSREKGPFLLDIKANKMVKLEIRSRA